MSVLMLWLCQFQHRLPLMCLLQSSFFELRRQRLRASQVQMYAVVPVHTPIYMMSAIIIPYTSQLYKFKQTDLVVHACNVHNTSSERAHICIMRVPICSHTCARVCLCMCVYVCVCVCVNERVCDFGDVACVRVYLCIYESVVRA